MSSRALNAYGIFSTPLYTRLLNKHTHIHRCTQCFQFPKWEFKKAVRENIHVYELSLIIRCHFLFMLCVRLARTYRNETLHYILKQKNIYLFYQSIYTLNLFQKYKLHFHLIIYLYTVAGICVFTYIRAINA